MISFVVADIIVLPLFLPAVNFSTISLGNHFYCTSWEHRDVGKERDPVSCPIVLERMLRSGEICLDVDNIWEGPDSDKGKGGQYPSIVRLRGHRKRGDLPQHETTSWGFPLHSPWALHPNLHSQATLFRWLDYGEISQPSFAQNSWYPNCNLKKLLI